MNYLKLYDCVQIISTRLEYLKPYNYAQTNYQYYSYYSENK